MRKVLHPSLYQVNTRLADLYTMKVIAMVPKKEVII